MKKYKVFVYGTLRKNESNHRLLNNTRCISEQCWTNGVLFDTGFGYPAMIYDHIGKVHGELYEVTAEVLQHLDNLEGYYGKNKNNLYERAMKPIYTDAGPTEAYLYVYSRNPATGNENIYYFNDWKLHHLINNKNILYFAYGSCMDNKRFIEAGIASQFSNIKGPGIAKNYSLAFTRKARDGGRADIIEASNGVVEGIVYEINVENTLDYLYSREGVYGNIYRPGCIDVEINGILHQNVLTFFVIHKEQYEVAPPEHYAREILRGAKSRVSNDYFERLQEDLLKKFNIFISIK
ncbi:gamma-glutamylcyclotransferase [Evansella sp. AB-P1]|uniref:gamma-glutamylcyclotransferase n=1 Tax=Evansella sp. AB-P1 TaxID=3037653 RepID=UPI00241EB852|nr:gamma-glutamylcyclotransferase family protein [Evansella sp. AB-P1]MDG5787172.1 gamma-glutamylcyclotransferase [Evansella sp. AB-P1]